MFCDFFRDTKFTLVLHFSHSLNETDSSAPIPQKEQGWCEKVRDLHFNQVQDTFKCLNTSSFILSNKKVGIAPILQGGN